MRSARLNPLILTASVLALLLGPMLFVLFLGTAIGYGFGGAMTVLGAAGLWIGMKALERNRAGDSEKGGDSS